MYLCPTASLLSIYFIPFWAFAWKNNVYEINQLTFLPQSVGKKSLISNTDFSILKNYFLEICILETVIRI